MGPLTEEQRERIRINRERALEIQRRKREEREQQQQQQQHQGGLGGDERSQAQSSSVSIHEDGKKISAGKRKADVDESKIESMNSSSLPSSSPPQKKVQKTTTTDSFLDDGLPIEPFEEGASEWVTKKEAMSTYCLSEGTLAVLQVEERENPHNKLWKPMKLYRRTDVRQWAHKRWNGLRGLQAERERRQTKKFEKDMKDADDIFK